MGAPRSRTPTDGVMLLQNEQKAPFTDTPGDAKKLNSRQFTRLSSYFANPSLDSSWIKNVAEIKAPSLLDHEPLIQQPSSLPELKGKLNFRENPAATDRKLQGTFDPFHSVVRGTMDKNQTHDTTAKGRLDASSPTFLTANSNVPTAIYPGFPTTFSIPTNSTTMTSGLNGDSIWLNGGGHMEATEDDLALYGEKATKHSPAPLDVAFQQFDNSAYGHTYNAQRQHPFAQPPSQADTQEQISEPASGDEFGSLRSRNSAPSSGIASTRSLEDISFRMNTSHHQQPPAEHPERSLASSPSRPGSQRQLSETYQQQRHAGASSQASHQRRSSEQSGSLNLGDSDPLLEDGSAATAGVYGPPGSRDHRPGDAHRRQSHAEPSSQTGPLNLGGSAPLLGSGPGGLYGPSGIDYPADNLFGELYRQQPLARPSSQTGSQGQPCLQFGSFGPQNRTPLTGGGSVVGNRPLDPGSLAQHRLDDTYRPSFTQSNRSTMFPSLTLDTGGSPQYRPEGLAPQSLADLVANVAPNVYGFANNHANPNLYKMAPTSPYAFPSHRESSHPADLNYAAYAAAGLASSSPGQPALGSSFDLMSDLMSGIQQSSCYPPRGWSSPAPAEYAAVSGYGRLQSPSVPPYLQSTSPLHALNRMEDGLRKPPASALMLLFRRDPNALKTWSLKAIEGHVAEFAGDQQGSRLIQNRLDGATNEEKLIVYNEMFSNVRQFMNDIYANYIVQKLFDLMDMPHKLELASSMKGHMLRLSMHTYGCRVVQKALEVLIDPQRARLVQELDGHVEKIIADQNGNHVIQKAIEFIDNSSVDFIINFFKGNIRRYSKHAYGCRVIQRMLEHCKETDIVWILGEIRECAVELIRDTYGNYVIQHIIRRGSTENRRFMEDIIASRMIEFSKHKYASNVVECAIKHTDKEHLMSFVTPFSCSQDVLLSAMRDPYTNYVIQTLLETLKGPDRHDFVVSLKALFPKLKERKEIESINQKQITALEEHLNSPKYETGHSYSDDALASAFSDSMHLDDSKKHCSSVNDLKSLSYSEQVKRGPTANTPRRIRRNKSGKPIQPRSVSPDSFSEALGRSRRPRKGISSESSSVHDSSEPSYITDTTATTPSVSEAVPEVAGRRNVATSPSSASVGDEASGRQTQSQPLVGSERLMRMFHQGDAAFD